MGKIYSLAHRVIVWLGPATPNGSSDRALEVLEHLGDQTEYTEGFTLLPTPNTSPKQSLSSGGAELTKVFDLSSPLSLSESDLVAIRLLLERSWWDRLWVWQEIHVASSRSLIQCGHCSAPWSMIRRGMARPTGFRHYSPTYTGLAPQELQHILLHRLAVWPYQANTKSEVFREGMFFPEQIARTFC
jgi:hypothetical protein